MPNEVKIPKFAYPFKRRSNTATKTKSDQEIFEEILFKDKTAQYLFNSSGLFHGGVHLKAKEFEIDFEVESIRAIADGELVYYRIDKEYLKNKLEDTFGEFEVLYSTGFFLLEHKMEYPKGNRLKFYSLSMHTAPSYEYEFEEYVVMGASAYARKTSDNSKADEFVKFGDKVVLGKPIANKDGRYELLTVNGIKMPSGYNVHISNLQYEAVVTTVTGSKPNMRKGNKNTSPSEGLLKDKSSITVHPYQTEEQKKYKRYKVLKAIKADGTPAVVSSKSTIHASNIKAKIPEVHIYTKKNNGIVQPHMKEMAGSNLKPASLNFKVKAGEELGKLGVYNSEWSETELDKMVHLEVFTFDDLKGFIEKAQEAYKKDPKDLSDEEKKLRPKENLFVVPKDEKELFILDDAIYGVTTKNTSIREGMVKTDTNFYKLAPSGTELELSNNKNTKRQQIKEWVGETLDENKIYSVHIAHVDFYKKFIPVPQESEVLTKSIRKSPSKLKILKDKDKNEYVCIDENIRLYVKKKKEYFTHGITFSNFTLIDEAGADKIGIFEDISKYYEKKTEEDKTPQQDKEKLNDTFKAILQKIQIDKNKDGKLEAGEFASLSLTKEKRKELSYMMVKHESEWEYQKEKFQPILDYMKNHNQNDRKKMFEDRLEKLALFPKDLVGKGKTPTFIHPIALVEGFVGGGCGNDCKTIDFKLSNGKYLKASEQTIKFILSYEGFKKYAYVPKDKNGNVLGSSGITIGYGYDLGQQSSSQIASDLNGLYTSAEIIKFQSVAGLKGENAVNKLSTVSDIITTKDIGVKLSRISKARYAQYTYNIYPEIINLHPHCQGALLSIVYNRGSGLSGNRRKEMRNIQTHLQNGEYNKIAKEITDMKRLWSAETARGLLLRRDKEAKYFTKGLKCKCN